MPSMKRPSPILVLGGLSHVGRHLVEGLVKAFGKETHIRVIDRQLTEHALLSAAHVAAFTNVEYIQANLGHPSVLEKIFAPPALDQSFERVFYCAADISYWEVEAVFQQRFVTDAVACASQAVATGCKVFLTVSSSMPYITPASGALVDEGGRMEQYNYRSTYMVRMEEALREVPNLPLVIVRPAVLWGPDERRFWIAVLIACDLFSRAGVAYEAPVGAKVNYSTVHVRDVARALIHLSTWYIQRRAEQIGVIPFSPVIFNLADNGHTTPKHVFRTASKVFPGLKASFIENSANAPLSPQELEENCDHVNEMLLEGWLGLLQSTGIKSPVTPFFEKEYCSLRPYSVDGRAIIRETGFQYHYDQGFTPQDMKEVVQQNINQGLWPPRELSE
ncbi:hypothetical protein BJ684DRAFT_20274 [Piptocephalis cylindrospora]|uniref:NAD-dependent epimerase/dehydratase domain-containing protein n=1 Tax=Piptocephalis cylindrospora TaxID=1907219 RepID=A0A4P9Y2Z4_9FUNG|nr:hypothetical protein BJ684DRAFT_20274 [Piptocephalis cylindrospora]|eukprot:RKP13225.1 hypothetical protein BJ684DRAFT_20274 [Piptocephalis cylindrospora]